MNEINFNGRYVSSAQVLKKSQNGKFLPHQLSLVEINVRNRNDILALKNIGEKWDGAMFANDIYDSARCICDSVKNNIFLRFFVLTNQKKNFRKLDPKEILSELEILFRPFDKKLEFIYFLTNPNFKYNSQESDYKHIGTGMLDAIKEKFKHRDIVLASNSESAKFYIKNGFKRYGADEYDFIYKHKK